jgi:GNAT superfamily N-acetyltransferase
MAAAAAQFVVFPRRDGIAYPQIYSKFKVKRDDNEVQFYIQDLTANYFDEAVDFIVDNHARGAVFHNAAATLVQESGVERVRAAYRRVFEEKISLICLRADTNEVVGLNALHIKSKHDAPPAVSDDPNFRKVMEATKFIETSFDVTSHYHVDRFMFAAGLCVDATYRGCGIATKILKARAPLMRAIGIELTTSIFSTTGAQKAAKAAGYDENFSITYEDFGRVLPSMNFSRFYGSSCKVLSLKV